MLYKNALKEFNAYVLEQKENAINEKTLDLINKKYIHSLEVVKDGNNVVNKLGFSDSFIDLVKICCLDHDVGRFLQANLIGDLSDFLLINKIGLNHGQLGGQILKEGLIYKQLPIRCYDTPIEIVVRNHVGIEIEAKDLLILTKEFLKTDDARYFFQFGSLDMRMKVINAITQIVQDVDRLDIYHQILDGRYNPLKVEKKIDDRILELFYKRKYLNIKEICRNGLWNENVGELVRLSFINQIRLLSVAQLIQQENIIMKMKKIRNNPYVLDAFDYTKQSLDEMINSSEDGVTVKKLK